LRPPDDATKARLHILRTIHIVLLGAISIFVVILYGVVPNLDIQLPHQGGFTLTILGIGSGSVISIGIYLGFFTPKWFIKLTKPIYGDWTVYLTRASSLEAIGASGLMLGIFGAEWPISLALLVISFTALWRTFPKEADAKNTLGK
jgi:hypothetical protein